MFLLLILLSIFMFIIFAFYGIGIFLASRLYANKEPSTKEIDQLQIKLSYNTIKTLVPLQHL